MSHQKYLATKFKTSLWTSIGNELNETGEYYNRRVISSTEITKCINNGLLFVCSKLKCRKRKTQTIRYLNKPKKNKK